MKIVIYADSFHPAVGGTERVTFQLASGIASWNAVNSGEAFAVTVVTRTHGNPGDDNGLPFTVVRRPSFGELRRLFRAADVVHLAGPALVPMVVAISLRKPFVIEHHGFQVVCPNGQLFKRPEQLLCDGRYGQGKFADCFACNRPQGTVRSAKLLVLTPLRRWLVRRASLNVTPTDWLASMIRLPRMKTIRHGFEMLPEASECEGPAADVIVIAFQGRLVSTKGVRVLLDAAKILRSEGLHFRLKIVGDGPDRAMIEERARELGDAIELFGELPDAKLGSALDDVSIVAVPSLAGEVFGLVVAESMMRGKAVVASDMGSFAEILGGAGTLFPAGDASALAVALRELMANRNRMRTFATAARRRAQSDFAIQRMLAEHIAAYSEVLRGV